MSKFSLDSSVTSKEESNMDFSALDEKLGKGVAEALSTMIREAVVQGITTVLPEIVKTVGSSPKSVSDGVKLSNATPVVTPPSDTSKRRKLSNTASVVTPLSDPLKEILDANPSMCLGDEPVTRKNTWRCKEKKRGLPVNAVKKELQFAKKFPPGSPWLYYNNYDPNMDGDDMPRCLDLVFRPTKEMKFFNKELAIAAYIFGKNMDPEEVLVPNDHCSGTRKTLLTIMPGNPIIGDVLTLVCSMLTKGHFGPKGNIHANQWFLPPTFSQIVLSPKQNCVRTMKYIKDNFMGDLASLHQIFVPIHLNSHWFLIVVDLLNGVVKYLDSFKKGTLEAERKSVINTLLNYLEEFLSEKNFGETPSFRNIQFSKYKFREPDVPQQSAKSNNCGIWVTQWMQLTRYWNLGNKTWVISDYTRMRLAVDLVNDENNSKRDIIEELAITDWNKKMQQSVMQT
ncbi:Ulp1 protease family, carboxy-terminal domain protein [Arachis hypogaea]|nr:Ulp1 protease family, carboxy-terminal domain protein [Arachis hypogaea]